MTGVTYDKDRPRKPYQAQIVIQNRTVYLGNYLTEQEAAEAYQKAREANPRLPRSGGNHVTSYPKQRCKICGDYIATPQFNRHTKACIRKFKEDFPDAVHYYEPR